MCLLACATSHSLRDEALRFPKFADDSLSGGTPLGHELAPLVKPVDMVASRPDSFKGGHFSSPLA